MLQHNNISCSNILNFKKTNMSLIIKFYETLVVSFENNCLLSRCLLVLQTSITVWSDWILSFDCRQYALIINKHLALIDINVLIRGYVINICRNKQPSGKKKIVINKSYYFYNNL